MSRHASGRQVVESAETVTFSDMTMTARERTVQYRTHDQIAALVCANLVIFVVAAASVFGAEFFTDPAPKDTATEYPAQPRPPKDQLSTAAPDAPSTRAAGTATPAGTPGPAVPEVPAATGPSGPGASAPTFDPFEPPSAPAPSDPGPLTPIVDEVLAPLLGDDGLVPAVFDTVRDVLAGLV